MFRKTPEMLTNLRTTKKWRTPIAKELKAERVRGKVLGIVGFGKIGKATAQRAKAFGMQVVFYDPYVEDGLDKVFQVTRVDTLKDLMSRVDVISCADSGCPHWSSSSRSSPVTFRRRVFVCLFVRLLFVLFPTQVTLFLG